MSRTTYSSYESDTQRPSVDVFPALAKFLDVTIDEFLVLYGATAIAAIRPSLDRLLSNSNDSSARQADPDGVEETTDEGTTVPTTDATPTSSTTTVPTTDATPTSSTTAVPNAPLAPSTSAVLSPPQASASSNTSAHGLELIQKKKKSKSKKKRKKS